MSRKFKYEYVTRLKPLFKVKHEYVTRLKPFFNGKGDAERNEDE